MTITSAPIRIFLSSPFRAADDDAEELLAFRRQLKLDAAKFGLEVVLAEDYTMGAVASSDASGASHIRIISTCSNHIDAADGVVAMIFQRHGSPLPFGKVASVDLVSDVSIFETEMLIAAMKAKPMLFVHVDGYQPHAKLAAFLALIKGASASHVHSPQRDIAATIELWARNLRQPQPTFNGSLFDLLLRSRQARRSHDEALRPELIFLEGVQTLSTEGTSNLVLIKTAIETARNGVDAHGNPIQETGRLALLWTAFRELFKENSEEALRQRAAIWHDALGAWASRAAWAGLKGPFMLGELAAVNMNHRIMTQVNIGKPLPFGARASALLGVTQFAQQRGTRVALLRTAAELCSLHIEANPENPSGAYLIRGAVQRKLATEGYPWRVWSSLADYQEAARIRRRMRMPASAIGEALVDLGFVKSAIYRRWGLAEMREGVALLEADKEGFRNRVGFVVRAKEKLEIGLRKAGHIDEAIVQATEAAALRERFGIGK